MLVHVRRHDTEFSAGHQDAKALLEYGTDSFKEASVNWLVADVLVPFSVISLVPIRGTSDHQADRIRGEKFHVAAVAEDDLCVFLPVRQGMATSKNDFGIIGVLLDAH